MGYKEKQQERKLKRKPFRDAVNVHFECNNIKKQDIIEVLGLSPQEYYNLLNGLSSSAPSKGFDTYGDFEQKLTMLLGDGFIY